MTFLDGQSGPGLREGGYMGKMSRRSKSHRGKIVMAGKRYIHSLYKSLLLFGFEELLSIKSRFHHSSILVLHCCSDYNDISFCDFLNYFFCKYVFRFPKAFTIPILKVEMNFSPIKVSTQKCECIEGVYGLIAILAHFLPPCRRWWQFKP